MKAHISDNPENQGCGCSGMEPTKDRHSLNTTICIDSSLDNKIVPTEYMCSPNTDCLFPPDYHGLCAADNSIFVCSSGKRIPNTDTCNLKDDCGTVNNKGYSLFEDEANCRNPEHERGISCKDRDGTQIWVPPKYRCDGETMCRGGDDEEKCPMKGALVCEKDRNNATVYPFQLCDPTHHEYCDNNELVYMNCSSPKSGNENLLRCPYKGYETVVNKYLECDEQTVCDNGADEVCFVTRGETDNICRFNEIRFGKNDVCEDDTIKISKTDFVKCPKVEGSYISSHMICDGKNDCDDRDPSKTEEGMCEISTTSRKYLSFILLTRQQYFDKACTPGIVKDENVTCFTVKYHVKENVKCNDDFSECSKSFTYAHCNLTYIGQSEQRSSCNASIADFSEYVVVHIPISRFHDFRAYRECSGGKDLPPKVVLFTKWCNLEVNCFNAEDERDCPENFLCDDQSPAAQFIPRNLVCDGKFDCKNGTDECNSNCSEFSIVKRVLQPVAAVIGFLALIVNVFSIFKYASTVSRIYSVNALFNQSFIALIAVGDLLVGLYMIGILIADVSIGSTFCTERWTWLSSRACVAMGCISTLGTMTSMFAMTSLSIFRMFTLKSMINLGDVSKSTYPKLGVLLISIFLAALFLSIVPVIAWEDYFVNGLFFPENPFFKNIARREDIKRVVNYVVNSNESSTDQHYNSWKNNTVYIKDLYYKPENNFRAQTIGFYGNQGVCLFKYFVTRKDPQVRFSLGIMFLSIACFVIITVCYIFIFYYAAASTKTAGNKQGRKAMSRLQHKVTLIIATDFLTWIPFITIAKLHFFEIIDATPWYDFCSIFLIPINSVINPVIYNGDELYSKVKSLKNRLISRTPAWSRTRRAVTLTSELTDNVLVLESRSKVEC